MRKKCQCGKIYKATLNACPDCKVPEAFSDCVPYNPLHWVYDLECYPNVFTCGLIHANTGTRLLFEISDRKNELIQLIDFLHALEYTDCSMIGFNNIGYDYPLIHFILNTFQQGITYDDIYARSMQIINTPWERRFDNLIYDSDVRIKQIDLFKIHHFDNEARRTSLKEIEFNMCMGTIEDLPYPPGTTLGDFEKNKLIKYNDHDIDATFDFYKESIELIEFREELSKKYSRDFMNHNDTKIGKDFFIMELEKALPGSCYDYSMGSKAPRQTRRNFINLGDVIFPYIYFKNDEFERIRSYLASQTITETKGVFNDVSCTVNGFQFDFGVGGIHGSIDSCVIESDGDYIIYDWDVASYYPNLAIANKLYPEHLSETFCKIYKEVFDQRRQYKKGTAENAMLKLALNGVYGDSNNKYSPFYDPKYTMSITINGQLLLCVLAQYLMDVPDLHMVQINTDGLTVRVHRDQVERMTAICKWWESFTLLELESVIYKRMFIRDVNNYIAEKEDGTLKRKGAYCLETPFDNIYTLELLWHKDHSALIVPKAVEAHLIHGKDVREFIVKHENKFDFMLRAKVGRKDLLMLDDTQQQRITRYYVSKTGGTLTKVSPPPNGIKPGTWKRANGITDGYYNAVLAEVGSAWDERIHTKNKSVYGERRTKFCSGWLVTPCNDITTFNRNNLNYEYYIAEAEKLIKPLKRVV